jgi:hypothetical protein
MTKFPLLLAVALLSWCADKQSKPRAAPGVPFANESLPYSVNWPSGLSLGEAQMRASRSAKTWTFELTLEAALPGFKVNDSYRSIAGDGFCSVEFVKRLEHGKRKADEKTTFDAATRTATRKTTEGGQSELSIPLCAHDALAFLYHVRDELRSGRLPAPQTVYFGAPYQLRLDYGGTQTVRFGDSSAPADRITASLKGPASQLAFDLYFARDEVRTPLVIRVPLPVGTFSMELVR